MMNNRSRNEIKSMALRLEVLEGFAQIDRGEYTEFDEYTI